MRNLTGGADGAGADGAGADGGAGAGEDLARLQRALAALAAPPPGGRAPGGSLVEAVPAEPAGRHRALSAFADASPIYGAPGRPADVGGVRCTVLTGDTNRLWLGSVRNARSRAPFSPTWLASAYELAAAARRAGCTEAVDIGSGDGRIAHCAAVLGMRAHSIELDGELAGLQREAAGRAGVRIDVRHADAAGFDYGRLGLSRPALFVGGLAQMGGVGLAGGAMRLASSGAAAGAALLVLPGTLSPKYAPDPHGMAGWGPALRAAGMGVERTLPLPAAWTFGEPDPVQYLLARARGGAGGHGGHPARAADAAAGRPDAGPAAPALLRALA